MQVNENIVSYKANYRQK